MHNVKWEVFFTEDFDCNCWTVSRDGEEAAVFWVDVLGYDKAKAEANKWMEAQGDE